MMPALQCRTELEILHDTPNAELEAFLAANPDIEHFDAFLNDLNTVERGKRLDRKGIEKAYCLRHAAAGLHVRARCARRNGGSDRPWVR